MCVEVTIGNKFVDTIRKLEAEIGGEAVILDGYSIGPSDKHCCLCPVDLPATAAKFGHTLKEDKDDWGWHWLMEKKRED